MKIVNFNDNNIFMNNSYSDVGSRIGTMLFLLAGENRVNKIMPFTDRTEDYKVDILDRSDDGKNLRGAYGPRARWWVGADQYAEVQRLNSEVTDIKDLMKPKGIDQFRQVCDDIHRYGMRTSTIVIRDPSVDFEETADIPELLACNFYKSDGKLYLTMIYETFDRKSNINDVWAWSKMLEFAASFMNLKYGGVEICVVRDSKLDAVMGDIYNSNNENLSLLQTEDYITDNVTVFWDDITNVLNIVDHIRCMIREEVLEQPDVSVEAELEMIYRAREERLKIKYFKSLLNAFLIWVITCRLQNYGEDADNHVIELLDQVEGSYKYEILAFLLNFGVSAAVYDKVEDVTCHR